MNYALFNLDASVVVNKVLEADDVNFGYDAMEGEYVNMIEQGIIDPTKVITNINTENTNLESYRKNWIMLGCSHCIYRFSGC